MVCYSIGMSENATPKTYRRPVMVASTVLISGIAVSLWFNLKAISLDANADMGAYASGILWPLFLLVSIELLIHTPWRDGVADTAIKVAVLVFVAGVAAWISYWHGVHVLDSWDYDQIGMRLGPIVPDAAMALATLALQRVGQARRVATAMIVATELATVAIDLEEPVAMATIQEPTLDEDWGNLEAELATWTAEAQTTEPATAEEPAPVAPRTAGTLTTVKREAAERILALLADGVEGKELDAKVAAEFNASDRTARRWRAALGNGTARVS